MRVRASRQARQQTVELLRSLIPTSCRLTVTMFGRMKLVSRSRAEHTMWSTTATAFRYSVDMTDPDVQVAAMAANALRTVVLHLDRAKSGWGRGLAGTTWSGRATTYGDEIMVEVTIANECIASSRISTGLRRRMVPITVEARPRRSPPALIWGNGPDPRQ